MQLLHAPLDLSNSSIENVFMLKKLGAGVLVIIWFVPEEMDKTAKGFITHVTQQNFCLIRQSVTGQPNV